MQRFISHPEKVFFPLIFLRNNFTETHVPIRRRTRSQFWKWLSKRWGGRPRTGHVTPRMRGLTGNHNKKNKVYLWLYEKKKTWLTDTSFMENNEFPVGFQEWYDFFDEHNLKTLLNTSPLLGYCNFKTTRREGNFWKIRRNFSKRIQTDHG